jgi:hypothetical protein
MGLPNRPVFKLPAPPPPKVVLAPPSAPVKAPPAPIVTSKNEKAASKAAQGPAQLTPEEQAIEDRFGNDMAWLDEEFQIDPALLGESARSKVEADPNMIAAQQRALDSLFGIADAGGATAQERARRAKARGESENWLRGQREADMQNLAERGMAGSGAEILALGNDRQAAAQRNSAADLETDAWLEQRALDALFSGGQLAGEMRTTGFNEGMARAGAADEFEALNQNTLNSAQQSNKQFQQEAWNRMIERRSAEDMKRLQMGLGAAEGLMGSDVGQNQAGYSYSGNVAGQSAGQANQGRNAANSYLGASGINEQAKKDRDQNFEDGFAEYGQYADTAISTGAGGGMGGGAGAMMGGMGGGGGGAPSGGGGGAIFDEDDVFGG